MSWIAFGHLGKFPKAMYGNVPSSRKKHENFRRDCGQSIVCRVLRDIGVSNANLIEKEG